MKLFSPMHECFKIFSVRVNQWTNWKWISLEIYKKRGQSLKSSCGELTCNLQLVKIYFIQWKCPELEQFQNIVLCIGNVNFTDHMLGN